MSLLTASFNHVKGALQGKHPLFAIRSSRWKTYRHHWLLLNDECAGCGTKESLQVHHVVPFHKDRSKELDFTNYISLCEMAGGRECHFNLGHKRNWKNSNPIVRWSAAELRHSLGLPILRSKIPEALPK